MKIQLFVIALLMMSVFAGSIVLAESGRSGGDDDSDDDSELEIETEFEHGIEVESESSLELEADSALDESRFRGYPASAHVGTGWVIDNEKGYLLTLNWVSKVFVPKDDVDAEGTEVVRGTVRFGDTKLRFNAEQTGGSDDEKEFVLYSSRGEGKTKVGTLTLDKKSSYSDLTVWTGKLSLDGGASYELNIATKERAVRKDSSSESTSSTKTKSIRVECYDGLKETFSLEASSAQDVYVKAREFCADNCKDGKCGVNKLEAINERGSVESKTNVKVERNTISIEEETEASSSNSASVDASGKGLVSFWKRIFSRSGSNSGSN